MTRPLTVVIPVYRGWSDASHLVSQVRADDVEVIVVDDASGDAVAPVFARRNPDIQLVQREHNGGFAAAVNSGLARASGDVVAIVNSDVQLTLDALRNLARLATVRGAIVGPRILDGAGAITPSARRWQTIPRMLAEYIVPLRAMPSVDVRLRGIDLVALDASAPVPTEWLVGACLVMPRPVADRIGPMDERFHMNSEELDWQRRAADIGIPRIHDPTQEITHFGGKSSGGQEATFRSIWRARVLYVDKHGGRRARMLLVFGLVVSFVLMAPVMAVFGLVRGRLRWALRSIQLHGGVVVTSLTPAYRLLAGEHAQQEETRTQ